MNEHWKKEIRLRLAALNLDPARKVAIIEELAQDLEDRYRELLATGLGRADAERLTLAELSGIKWAEKSIPVEPVALGTQRRGGMIADLGQDLRYSARMILK